MTFEEFQKTKRYWSNANQHPFVDHADGSALIYDAGLVIEIIDHESGPFMLTLANEGWISYDLAKLELKLYNYGVGEQIWL